MSIAASAGSGSLARKAIHRPSGATSAMLRARASASISAVVARRSGRGSPSARNVVAARTAEGSTRWSNVATKTVSRASDSPPGAKEVTVAGGVLNSKETVASSVAPVAEAVPAGTSTR